MTIVEKLNLDSAVDLYGERSTEESRMMEVGHNKLDHDQPEYAPNAFHFFESEK